MQPEELPLHVRDGLRRVILRNSAVQLRSVAADLRELEAYDAIERIERAAEMLEQEAAHAAP